MLIKILGLNFTNLLLLLICYMSSSLFSAPQSIKVILNQFIDFKT